MEQANTGDRTEKVVKFNGSNYNEWSCGLTELLRGKDLWIITLDGEAAATALEEKTTVDNAQLLAKTMRIKNDRAFYFISSSIDDVYKVHVRGTTLVPNDQHINVPTAINGNAKLAWAEMLNKFKEQTLADQMYLTRRITNAKMGEGTDVREHITTMMQMAADLASAGAPMTDKAQIIYILNSLPPSYAAFEASMELLADDLKLEDVKRKLLMEGTKRKE